jgi:hypothetical protein
MHDLETNSKAGLEASESSRAAEQLVDSSAEDHVAAGYGVTPSSAVGNNARREQWLYKVAESLHPRFAELGYPDRPAIRIGVGYPSTGAKGKAIGQCHDSSVSKDKVHELIISPRIDDSAEVAGVLAHEMCHAYLQKTFPNENCGHGKKFRRLALAVGLTGKMTATVPGDAFKRFVAPIIALIGAYPHGALESGQTRKVQGTRLLKVSCPSCEYTIRVTHKWIEVAIPACPAPDCNLFGERMEVSQ